MQKVVDWQAEIDRLAMVDVGQRRNAILDLLRERHFTFELKRQRRVKYIENIFVNTCVADRPRFLLCVNYAYPSDRYDFAATVLAALRILTEKRARFLSHIGVDNHHIPSPIEMVFLDGSEGHEGAAHYFWGLREDKRKHILGVIHLELGRDGNRVVASLPRVVGDGKLRAALYLASKQRKGFLAQEIPSPIDSAFEHDTIPLTTITTIAGAATEQSAIEQTTVFIGEVMRLLRFVKGDEIGDDVPDLTQLQHMQHMKLLQINDESAS